MDGRYLTFPELPPGYHYTYEEGVDDIYIFFCRTEEGLSRELMHDQLVAWVDVYSDDVSVKERSLSLDKHTHKQRVRTVQEGIDLLVARAWLGMTGLEG